MVTFKACIVRKDMRKDGTWPVLIRMTYKRQSRMIRTTMSVSEDDLTASDSFRNQKVRDECDRLIHTYRKRIAGLQLEFNDMEIDDIRRRITIKDPGENIDFIAFCKTWLEEYCSPKCRNNYASALRSFEKFIGSPSFSCNQMSKQVMQRYEKWLGEHGVEGTHYCVAVKKMFNEARCTYNDNPEGKAYIRRSLEFYFPKRYQKQVEKRALTIDQIRAIAAVPDEERVNSQRNMARDAFLISFMMMGTNAIDLMDCVYDGDGNITYERAKMRERCEDRARIVIFPHPLLKPYLEKYASDETGDSPRVFNFHERFSTSQVFNDKLNKGIKEVGRYVGIPDLTFYAARHSMATIALNDAAVDKYTVHEMLNHQVPIYRITDMYIKKDFRSINDASFKLIDLVLGPVMRKKTGDVDFLFTDAQEGAEHEDRIKFKYYVIPQDIHADRTWNVVIRVMLGREYKEIGTSVRVSQRDLNSDYNIISPTVIERCNGLVESCRRKVLDLNEGTMPIHIADVVSRLYV